MNESTLHYLLNSRQQRDKVIGWWTRCSAWSKKKIHIFSHMCKVCLLYFQCSSTFLSIKCLAHPSAWCLSCFQSNTVSVKRALSTDKLLLSDLCPLLTFKCYPHCNTSNTLATLAFFSKQFMCSGDNSVSGGHLIRVSCLMLIWQKL